MNKLSILIAIAIAIATTAFAQAPQQQLSANIDTWIDGTVISLDADGQRFAVRGVKLPFASAEAEMMKEIADDTRNLDATRREARSNEIKQKWQDRLSKAKTEQIATNPSDFNFVLPDKANLVILEDQHIMREGAGQEGLDKKVSVQGQASAPASTDQNLTGKDMTASGKAAAPSADDTLPESQVDQPAADKAAADKAVTAKAEEYDRKELTPVRTLKDLKVGDKVKVGFDNGLISNTAYVIVNDKEQAVR